MDSVLNRLYFEKFSNDEVLRYFQNSLAMYLPKKKTKILEIGCGQSDYILDFAKNFEHELFAIDKDHIAIDYLSKRISQLDNPAKVNFYAQEFSALKFNELTFGGIILHNFLHFYTLNQVEEIIQSLSPYMEKGTIISVIVHSWRHPSRGKKSPFKHFFKKSDFYRIFPKRKYEYLIYGTSSHLKTQDQVSFYNLYIEKLCKLNNIQDEVEIKKYQQEFRETNPRQEQLELLVQFR